MERKKYPIRAEDYQLFEVVGQGVSASVYRARCIPSTNVAIKIVDFERNNSDLSNICREAQTMILIDHPNVLKAHCSFVNDHNLWVVMPYMEGGSCLHVMKSAFPNGFEEVVIATVLREVLKGLEYLHNHGHIHRDVKAGNILVDARGAVKLGDFGVSACLFDSGDRQRSRNTFVGTPCWMAPEVMEQLHGYDFKADIWSFGITALELAHGHAPFSKYPPIKVLTMKEKKFSKAFKEMISMCLVKDPLKRPSARKLLKQSFFKQARSQEYIVLKILDGLPALGVRHQALKDKEEDLLAQKKMLDSEKEELSQNEYKRGISSWNFDMEELKAQASSILENEERKDSNACRILEIDGLQERGPEASLCSTLKDDDNVETEVSHGFTYSSPDRPVRFQSLRKQNQFPIVGNCNGELQRVIDTTFDAVPKLSKSPGIDDVEDKSKQPIVQRKGRFKVMSETVDFDKALPPIMLQKSHSIQVFSQLPSPSILAPTDAAPFDSFGYSMYPQLQSILQANILQRDYILHLMKQVSNVESSSMPSGAVNRTVEGGPLLMPTAFSEKSLLEAANEREKELIQEICDLHSRLICTQEELKRLKARNNQVRLCHFPN